MDNYIHACDNFRTYGIMSDSDKIEIMLNKENSVKNNAIC
jgi:hypothetical protein